METTPTPPGSVLYKAFWTCLILLFGQITPIWSQGGSMDGNIFGHPVGSQLLINCGGGPCDAMRWTGGAAWIGACPNAACNIDDGPSANGGIVRCGNSAETQSNIHPNSCYDPGVFTAVIGGTCTDPNTGLPVALTLPLVDQQVLWFNFDVRAYAGGYDFQVIGGNEDIAWILFYSNTPQCCVGGFQTGISGDCSSLTYYTCGTSFNNWAAQPFNTPIFDLTTNVYLLVWDQGFSKGNVNDDDFSINFKARYGCGENCSFLTNGAPVITCLPNGSYTVFQNVVGTSTTVTVTAPGSTSIVTNPSPLTFTDLDPSPPPNVNSGTVTVTYPAGVNYNITMTPSGSGVNCNAINLSGTAPDCCTPPVCTIDGPANVCPSSTNTHCGPVGLAAYSWSISGGGTINGATNQPCVTVTASATCGTTYTLTLQAGIPSCQSTCMYTVTVSDTNPPSITCPPPVTVSCIGQVPPININSVMASDNCSSVTVTYVSDNITGTVCANRLTLTRIYRATDACGNSATCSQIITVNDQTPPSITCPAPVTVSCASLVPAPNVASVIKSDNCGGTPTVTFLGDVTTNQTCVNHYTITRTYRATDACGNSATCSQMITVNDQTPPTITCPASITVTCANMVPTPNPGSVSTSDNCNGAPTVTFVGDVTTNQTCTNKYTVTRTYRATDECNNSATCTQTITVNDQTPPTISCPAAVTVSCASQVPAPNTSSVTSSDNCGGNVTIAYLGDVISGQTCANRYIITRTYRATDACLNTATCTQVITVFDASPPSITCPPNVTVQCAVQVPAPNPAGVLASDNCNGSPVVTFEGDVITNQTCANRFTVTRTYKAVDECGNSATCTQVITVYDNTPPVITCPPNTTVSCPAFVPLPDPAGIVAFDNCNGLPVITFLGDVISNQTCANRYIITRSYNAIDECGNSASCSYTITVDDQTPPMLNCPPPVTVSCVNMVPAPDPAGILANDVCSGAPTVIFDGDVISNQTCINRFLITRTYRASDECGNSASCTQLITVNDQTPPMITCPVAITVSCASLVPPPSPGSILASDNCGDAPTVTFIGDVTTNQTCINRYLITRTYRAMDLCGNSATCTQTITVKDNIPPAMMCPPNITVTCATDVPAPNVGAVSATDGCSPDITITFDGDVINNQTCANRYTIARTYRANDNCWNSATCTQLIVVNDQTPPSISCPPDITVTCTELIPVPDISGVTASDNCNGQTIIQFVGDVISNQQCANRYTVIRTYRALDDCGNSATCNQLIYVDDQTPPSVSCPPDLTVSCANQIPPANPLEVIAIDDCIGPVTVIPLLDQISGLTCPNRFLITRTYVALDACGNSTTCSQLITVYDDIPPIIDCPDDITIDPESSTLPAVTGSATAIDNCGGESIISYTETFTPGPCVTDYFIHRTWTAVDLCGNSSSCLQEIAVQGGCVVDLSLTKNLAPGQDMNINPGDNVNFVIRVYNNGNVFAGSVSVVDYIPIGFTLNDPDWTPGMDGSTGQSASIELSIGNGLLPPGGLAPGSFAEIEITLKSDDNISGGEFTNTAEISGARGLDGTDIGDSDIDSHPDTNDTNDPPQEDDIDPLVFCVIIDPVILGDHMVCQGDTAVYTVESYNPQHHYDWLVGDGGVIINLTDSSITVLWYADPGSVITIELDESAGEECHFTALFDVTIGGAEAIACFDHINLSISDDCGTQILSGMILTGDQHGDNSYEVYVIDMVTGDTIPNATVNWTHVGKTFKVSVRSRCTGQSCWGFVTIEDKSPPIIECVCPAGESEEHCRIPCLVVDQLLNGIIPDNVRPKIVDNCGGATIDLTNVDLNYADCSHGSAVISWMATDAFGNTATCVQEFDIVPLDISELTWPRDYTGDCYESDDPENTGYPQLYGINLISVVQSCNIWTQYNDQVVPICGHGRKIIRRWTITNMCNGQSFNYIQTILLKDRVGPVLSCPADMTVSTSVWTCYADVNMPIPGAYDECSSVTNYQLFASGGTVVQNGNQFRITNLPVGTHQARWIVTDACYNTSTCIVQITVVDNVPPVVSCQSHTVVSLTNDRPNGITLVQAEAFDDGSFDNCTPVHFRVRRMTSCIDINWTTNGACVDDTPGGTPPIDDLDKGLAFGSCIPVNCCDIDHPFMVVLEVSDDAGNSNSCMVEVEVQDKLRPVITCPPTIELSCDYPLEVHPGTYTDAAGNGDGTLDEDPLSALFGNVYDAFRYHPSDRQHIIINDPGNTEDPQPHDWGLEGWAVDNCEVDLSVTVSVINDCSGNSLPVNHPADAVKLIERRFTAYDGVLTGTCVQRIWVIDYNRFFINDTTCENEDPTDGVIWPCDVLVTSCPMELTDTGEPIIFDDACSLIGTTYEDTRFDIADGACYKILREWKIIDWCQFNVNTGYGLWTYTQTIKVADNEGAEFLDCPSAPVALCTDDPGISLPANNQLFLGENNPNASSCSVQVIMHRTVREMCSLSVTYDVKIYPFNGQDFIQIKPETTVQLDANHEADLYFDTQESGIPSIELNGLPYNSPLCEDYHRVLWSVEDGCGNRTYCDYLFRLEDCKNPTPVCIDGLSTVVMPPSGEVTLFASDYNASSVDDCTPSNELLFSFSGATYEPSMTFNCDNVPAFGVPFDIEMWAADGGNDDNCDGVIDWSERNKDFCTASLVITDPNDICDNMGLVLEGEIMTDEVQAVSNVMVHLNGPQSPAPAFMTQDDGKYTFTGVQPGYDYDIRPERNDDPRNGVSTLDLVAIQKHLLGREPFTKASQYIAADANNSGTVSAIDLIEIRKLILGLYDEFPANQSWRFIRKEEADNPGPPWPLTESISLTALQPNENKDFNFVGVKIGDVNSSAKAHFNQIMPRNARLLTTVKTVVDKDIRKDQVVECKFIVPASIIGFQWTLETNGLEYLGVKSTSIPIDDSHIGLLPNGLITMSWNGEPFDGTSGHEDLTFILQFRANHDGTLQDMLRMTSSVTPAEAYTADEDIRDVQLEYDGDRSFTDFALYQNKPNPWNDQTLIEFDLPYDGVAKLTVYDVAGKMVKTVEGFYKAGHNTIMLTSHDIPTPGVLYYRLDSGPYSAVRKMMIFH